MTKDELLIELKKLLDVSDAEEAHVRAEELLLRYINDAEIKKARENTPCSVKLKKYFINKAIPIISIGTAKTASINLIIIYSLILLINF
jgi:hypothetical protein